MDMIIQVTLLVSAVLVVQKIFGMRLHVYVRYALWGIVAIRLFLPVNITGSPFSAVSIVDVMARQYGGSLYDRIALAGQDTFGGNTTVADSDVNVGDTKEMAGVIDNAAGAMQADNHKDISRGNRAADSDSNAAENGNQTENHGSVMTGGGLVSADVRQAQSTIMAGKLFHIIRLTGSLFVGGFLGAAYLRFRLRLCRMRRIYMDDLDTYIGMSRRIPVYRVKKLESPCLVGFIRPAIYVGKNVKTDSDSFRYIVIHEYVHYLHRDYIWAFLRIILLVVYWYHPFVWIAAAASAKDGEMACDYGTVRRLGEKERFSYSEMLLELSRGSRGRRVYSYGTMLWTGKSEIKERLVWLTGTDTSKISVCIMTGVLMAVMAGCAFTGKVAEVEESGRTIILTNPAGENIDTEDLEEHLEKELDVQPAQISGETSLGVDGIILDYASAMGNGRASIVIFHDYFGLVVYDLTNNKILRSLDLEPIGCNMTQGEDACQVAVSADGQRIWLHPMSKPYMYRYEVEENRLYEVPLVKNFETDLESEKLFDRFLAIEETLQKYVGWRSNYLYEEYEDEQGIQTAYIYLYVSEKDEQKLGNLACVWHDMVFMMFPGGEDVQEESTGQEETAVQEEFPYRYDGVTEKMSISYAVPCAYSRISDIFGERVHPVTQEVVRHEGIDFVAEQGAEVTAAADGVVYETGYLAEYGNYVVLLHANGDMTYYCQCKSIGVQKGEEVKQGDRIAEVGNTGMSTGSHLHFALSQNGKFVDPEMYLSISQ